MGERDQDFSLRSMRFLRAKSKSSSTRRGLCVGTKNEGFRRRSKKIDLGEIEVIGLRRGSWDFLPFRLRFKRYGSFLLWF